MPISTIAARSCAAQEGRSSIASARSSSCSMSMSSRSSISSVLSPPGPTSRSVSDLGVQHRRRVDLAPGASPRRISSRLSRRSSLVSRISVTSVISVISERQIVSARRSFVGRPSVPISGRCRRAAVGLEHERTLERAADHALREREAHERLDPRHVLRVEDRALEAHAQARERLVLTAHRPVAHGLPQLADLGVTRGQSHEQRIGEIRPLAGLLRVKRVQPADEAVALLPRRSGVHLLCVVQVAGHRLAHVASRVGDLGLTRDVGAGGLKRARERVPERDVAQVAGVQRRRGAGIAEVHDVGRALQQVARRRQLPPTRSPGAELGDARVADLDGRRLEEQVRRGVDVVRCRWP